MWNTPFDFAFRPSQATLTTDAAKGGWGAALLIGDLFWTTSGFFQPPDNLTSSNQRETAAVLHSLRHFLPTLQSQNIRALNLQSDNMTTVCNLTRQNAALPLLRMTRAIFSILLRANIGMKSTHIPGIQNTIADALSRLDTTGDYELRQEIYQHGIQTLGVTPSVDCFANINNRKCPRFFAPVENHLSKNAAAINGLYQPWSQKRMPFIHPPIPLIPQVLQKMMQEKCVAVLVVPFWPTRSWWSSVQSLLLRQVNLGPSHSVLIKGPSMGQQTLPPGDIVMCLISSRQ
jgi:hypothetical protein